MRRLTTLTLIAIALAGASVLLQSQGAPPTFPGNIPAWVNTANVIAKTADGLFKIVSNAGTVGVQFNTGTVAPTISACATGTILAGSRNMAGQVTATGATTCGINFGGPAWASAPRCVMSNMTANRGNLSTITTIMLTFSNLTAGDVVDWICLGSI